MFFIKGKSRGEASAGRVPLALVFGLILMSPNVGLAQVEARDDRSREALREERLTTAQALKNTRETGVPTLVLVTSNSNPDTMELWEELKDARENSPRRDGIQLIQVAIEELGNTAKTLGLKRAPAVLLYCREKGKVRLAGQHAGPMDVEFIGGWVGLYHRDGTKGKSAAEDGDVRLTNYQDYASAQSSPQYQQPRTPMKNPPAEPPYQAPPPPPPPQQPTYYPPQQQYYAPPPMMPVYQPQQPTMVYAPAPPPIYVQPAAPTIVMGAAPQPNFAFAPQPAPAPVAMAPVNLLAPQPTANAPQPNGNAPQPNGNAPQPPGYAPQPMTYAPAPQPVAFAPAPQPMYAPAPQPVAYAPAPQPVAYAPAPQPVAFAPQQAYAPAPASLGAAPALMLSNPRLFGRLLGTIGDSLSELGNPRIRMARAPAYQTPAITSLAADPVYPATRVYPVKRARPRAHYQEYDEEQEYEEAPQPPPPAYRAPRPSPQDDGYSLHNLFRKRGY